MPAMNLRNVMTRAARTEESATERLEAWAGESGVDFGTG